MNQVFYHPELSDHIELVGFWNCNEKFANIPSKDVPLWYLRVFGLWNFIKLGIFTILLTISLFLKSFFNNYYRTFDALCKSKNLQSNYSPNPNSKEIISWLKENDIELLVIMVGHILKTEILNAPKVATINKHAALLPMNKGVFPYFWAHIKNEPQGVSFHKVVEKIDAGEIVFQKNITEKNKLTSMISFYFEVYNNYGDQLYQTVKNLESDTVTTVNNKCSPSYHGLPNSKDYKLFKKNKGRIINISDFLIVFKL